MEKLMLPMSHNMDDSTASGLCRLRSPDSFDERSGHFRKATAKRVLMGFGMIFSGSLTSLMAAGGQTGRFPRKDQILAAGENLFQASVATDHVDVFIGHSWSACRCQKFLALCLFFNLGMAVKCSVATFLVAVVALLSSRGMTGLGGSSAALPCLVYLPIAAFFLVFIFGQQLTGGRWAPSVWVDKLCIHQTDMERKAEQIVSLPVFVARSSRMLILWDDTYFERLWCNLELATFARYGGADRVEVLPLWLAPWLLGSILLDLLSASIFELLEHIFPNWSAAWTNEIIGFAESIFGHNPAMVKFVAWFIIWMMSSIVYLPASIPSFFTLRMKLRNHQLMLDQMAEFDVRAAKCTVASDREAIEQQVKDNFSQDRLERVLSRLSTSKPGKVRRDSLIMSHADPLDNFNDYIRGPLRDKVIDEIGNELYVPWHMCLTAFLPMIFYSSVNVLGCDNGPCEKSAMLAGYSSASQYMIIQTIGWAMCILMAFLLTYPTLLRMLKFVLTHVDGPLQLVAAFLCCPLAYFYCYICGSLVWASLVSLVENYSPSQLMLFVLIMCFLLVQVVCLFSRSSGHGEPQSSSLRNHAYQNAETADSLLGGVSDTP
ncbi:unnamed protein product [Effrenium voratum]|uniref:Transmembrane protein n=1 Tax=Effrenium voratum TaxID=2562239 RepID=A0AA36MMP2_9DINO|nr:unnamed protein product [Effrenium voratum]